MKKFTNSGQFKKTHGLSFTSEHDAWGHMKQRCYNKSSLAYKWYGARGIKVCERWKKSFSDFIKDMGMKPSKDYSLERVDNDGDYCKENCLWIPKNMQQKNRRIVIKFNGENCSEASTRLGGTINLVGKRLKKGWSFKDAFTKLARRKIKSKSQRDL